jgi:hypothetical protein
MKAKILVVCWFVLFTGGVSIKVASAGESTSVTESSPVSQSNQLNDVERKKRHLVSRFYEITVWGATICPIDKYPGYHSSLSRFQTTFPDLIPLINASPYRSYAEQMKQQAESSDFAKREALKWRDSTCRFYEEAMNANAQDERGQKAIREIVELLKQ